MFRDSNSYGSAVVRHPDGSINFDAYRAIARRERQAAIAASIQRMLSRIASVFVGEPGAATHQPHHAR